MEGVLYRHDDPGFSITHPGWRVLPPPRGKGVMLLDDSAEGVLATSLLAGVVRLSADLPQDEFANAQLAALWAYATDLWIVDAGTDDLDGREYHRILATYRQGAFGIAIEQWYACHDGLGVVLSAQGDANSYDDLSEAWRDIAGSFALDGA
jgi:hypothetical protein